MALISASTILTSLSLFHLTLGYFFYTDPQAIADQALVWVLGEATGIPPTQTFSHPTPTTSFLSIILLLLGLSDLMTLSMPQEIWLIHYWGPQAPARSIVFGLLTIFVYFTSSSYPTTSSRSSTSKYVSGGNDGLRNNVFFTFALLEFLSWLWAWVTLREEATAFTTRKRRRSRELLS
ncbi:increased loss of mitochondrial DNA protein 1 [Poronia punctata]|nr:increased loss of mitochondrial DNA protein 1 [Poronia punctata]